MFLTVITPTHERPRLLERCKESVMKQTGCQPPQHIIYHDYKGLGMAEVFATIPALSPAIDGRYVMALADDDILASPHVAAVIEELAVQFDYPEVFMGYVRIGKNVFPSDECWMAEPKLGHVTWSNVVVRKDIWKRHAGDHGYRYEGDFDFIHALWERNYRTVYLNELLVIAPYGWGNGLTEKEILQ